METLQNGHYSVGKLTQTFQKDFQLKNKGAFLFFTTKKDQRKRIELASTFLPQSHLYLFIYVAGKSYKSHPAIGRFRCCFCIVSLGKEPS